MGPGGRGGSAANGGRKAVLRNKSEDMNDPDFRRNRSCGGWDCDGEMWARAGVRVAV